MTRRLRLCLIAALMVVGILPATAARASVSQESTFQDDNLLTFSTPQHTAQTLDSLRGLGVNRIRVSVFWKAVAPDPESKTRPNFNAADPGAYPPGSWDRYDNLIAMARARGMDVNFDVTDPAPFWATGKPDRADIEKTYTPSTQEFGLFMRAIATRYSGNYVPSTPSPGAPAGQPLPRVSYWAIWNEPDQAGWLTPQWIPSSGSPGGWLETSPILYRGLVDAGWAALQATGHGSDTILIGETAPKGLNVKGITRAIKPLHFIRQLYCLDDAYHPLQGAAAQARQCPSTPDAVRAFPAAHPGLFAATGWAHHPYELLFAPNHRPPDPDYVTIANLPRLTGALSTAMRLYGQGRAGGMPLYLTEFGYQSKPPSPIGVTLSQQAAYLNQSEFISYTNPTVRTLSQFLLVDDAPHSKGPNDLAAFGATFETGLLLRNGRRKPAFAAYRLPIYIPHPKGRRGRSIRVWGLVRSAPAGSVQSVAVEFRTSKGRKGYRRLALARTVRGRYVDTHVRLRGAGAIRLSWTDPKTHAVLRSRSISVRVK